MQHCPVHNRMKAVYNDEGLPGEQFARDRVPKEQASQFQASMTTNQRELKATPVTSAFDTLFDDNFFWQSIEIAAKAHDPFMLASPGKIFLVKKCSNDYIGLESKHMYW